MGESFGLLGDDCGVHVDYFCTAFSGLAGGFFEKELAGCATPARIAVGEEMADVYFTEGAKDGIDDGVDEYIGIGVTVQAFHMRNIDATEDEFAARNQRM